MGVLGWEGSGSGGGARGAVWGAWFGMNVPQQLRPSLDRAPGPCPMPGLLCPAPAQPASGKKGGHCSQSLAPCEGSRENGLWLTEVVGLKDGETLEGKDGMERLRETQEAGDGRTAPPPAPPSCWGVRGCPRPLALPA